MAYVVLAFECLKYGGGVHHVGNETWLTGWLANAEQILYWPLMVFMKLSISLQYLRTFVPTHTGRLHRIVQVLIWFNIMFYGVLTFVVIFECIPREKIWKPLTTGHCVDINSSFIISAAVNVISDFSIFLLPLMRMWNLQMAKKQKIALSAVFATGLLWVYLLFSSATIAQDQSIDFI